MPARRHGGLPAVEERALRHPGADPRVDLVGRAEPVVVHCLVVGVRVRAADLDLVVVARARAAAARARVVGRTERVLHVAAARDLLEPAVRLAAHHVVDERVVGAHGRHERDRRGAAVAHGRPRAHRTLAVRVRAHAHVLLDGPGVEQHQVAASHRVRLGVDGCAAEGAQQEQRTQGSRRHAHGNSSVRQDGRNPTGASRCGVAPRAPLPKKDATAPHPRASFFPARRVGLTPMPTCLPGKVDRLRECGCRVSCGKQTGSDGMAWADPCPACRSAGHREVPASPI